MSVTAAKPEEMVHSLQQSQWFSPNELRFHQRPLLERLLRHAATQTDFYRDRLQPLFDGEDPASAPIDLSKWDEVPILRRADAVHSVAHMTARKVPRSSGVARHGESSGTTGRPFPHLRSAFAVTVANCLLQRVYEVFEIDLKAPLAMITFDKEGTCRYPEGGRFKHWNFHAPDADLYALHIGATPGEQLEWLRRMQPAHVMTYPETLREVAEAAEALGQRLTFQTFISSGESLLATTREKIARTFGCRTIDIYGTREIGPIAFQCPEAEGYHACVEAMIFELLDDSNQPVAHGEFGRVVVTPLHNFAMPFIRYDVGDYARAGPGPCFCGRGLPWLQEIGGRTRNMFVMPDGSCKRWQGVIMRRMPDFLSYKEIQFVQTDVNSVELRYVPDDAGAAIRLAELTDFLRRELHGAVDVKATRVERIERGAGMKLEQFVCLVA
jgi:phenylacetate-CoA ligase